MEGEGISTEPWSNGENFDQIKPRTVFHTTKDLVSNGWPFRGNEENTNFNEEASGGLYLNTFTDLHFAQDPNLEEIAKRLPKNAKNTSPQLQNEVIETLSEIVSQTIANECKKAELLTFMMDGTSDTNNRYLIHNFICMYLSYFKYKISNANIIIFYNLQ